MRIVLPSPGILTLLAISESFRIRRQSLALEAMYNEVQRKYADYKAKAIEFVCEEDLDEMYEPFDMFT